MAAKKHDCYRCAFSYLYLFLLNKNDTLWTAVAWLTLLLKSLTTAMKQRMS